MGVIDDHGHWANISVQQPGKEDPGVAPDPGTSHHVAMTDMSREEVKARLEASEARVAASMETLRSDLGAGVARIDVGLSKIDTGLAKMDAKLAEILMAVEKGKSDRYATGYKIITWTIGTVFALAGLLLSIYRTFLSH